MTQPADTSPSVAIFEIITPEGRAYRIWPSGEIEGFGDDAIIINRIPQHTKSAIARAMDRKAAA